MPSFCLALVCIGTNNKVTYEEVLATQKYIQAELSKRGVRILNFSADGDSQLLKSMTIKLFLHLINHLQVKQYRLPC